MLSERLYGGIREKSIEFFRKVYRVSPKSLESIFRKSIDFSPTLPYKRSVISHPPFRCYGTTDPHPPILRSVSFVEMLCILPFSVPTSPIPRSDTFVQKPRFLPSSSPTSLTLSAGSLPTNNPIPPPIPCPIITHLTPRFFVQSPDTYHPLLHFLRINDLHSSIFCPSIFHA